MKKPLENVSVAVKEIPVIVSKKKWMKVKTARRFLARNRHKIVEMHLDKELGRSNSFSRRVLDARLILAQKIKKEPAYE